MGNCHFKQVSYKAAITISATFQLWVTFKFSKAQEMKVMCHLNYFKCAQKVVNENCKEIYSEQLTLGSDQFNARQVIKVLEIKLVVHFPFMFLV